MPDIRGLLPNLPWEGPPLPRDVWAILTPLLPRRIHIQREGIRKLDKVIDWYLSREGELTDAEIAHVDELVRLRDAAVRRLTEMKRLGR